MKSNGIFSNNRLMQISLNPKKKSIKNGDTKKNINCTNLAPCLPPLFGFTKTTRGLVLGKGEIIIGIPS